MDFDEKTPVREGFLSAITLFLRVEEIPTHCLLIKGYRVSRNSANASDEVRVCLLSQNPLQTHLEFELHVLDPHVCPVCSLCDHWQRCWRSLCLSANPTSASCRPWNHTRSQPLAPTPKICACIHNTVWHKKERSRGLRSCMACYLLPGSLHEIRA